jgi:very-short-patch-repair endonuclease
LDKYIVDFYCRKLDLVIEVDGASHQEDQAHLADVDRESALRAMGLSVLRFSEEEVRYQMPDVLERISQWIEQKERESP